MKFKPEYVALAVNALSTLYYVYRWDEPGKIVYWIGATLITVGLAMMRG